MVDMCEAAAEKSNISGERHPFGGVALMTISALSRRVFIS